MVPFPVPLHSKGNSMPDLSQIYQLAYTVGEILTMTWPGRLVLGMAVGSFLLRLARA